ncbi:MAG: rhomboid family intramembrane serine protease [Lachnospiraceae bacterium]|nr:rhomboid family intramembrane serine protease [Lachnospiraceae bacterium]
MNTQNTQNNSIDTFLMMQGYRLTARSGNGDVVVFLRQTNFGIDMVTVVDMVGHPELEGTYIDSVVRGMTERVQMITRQIPRNLSLIIAERNEKGLAICQQNANYWYLDSLDEKIYLYENHMQDFQGLRAPLENWIGEKGIHLGALPPAMTPRPKRSIPVWVIAAINIVMFLMTMQGAISLKMMALDAESLFVKGEVYRLITNLFMHGSFLHIFYNMFVLFMVGGYAGQFFGNARLCIGYVVSGLVGGLFSMIYSVKTGNVYMTLGASGAIYGIFGMLLFYMVTNRGTFGKDLWFRIGMALICMLLSTTESTNTDFMAHLGGFLGGVFAAAVFALVGWMFNKKETSTAEKGEQG